MPLHGARLFSSDLYAESTAEEFQAALRLWWSAWLQTPAGSLPASDNALAVLADFKRDMPGWLKVKDRALHGFVMCSDGRLYHPFLCSEAIKAHRMRLKSEKKRRDDRERLISWRAKKTAAPETDIETAATPNSKCVGNGDETRFETRFVAVRSEVKRSKKEEKKESPLPPKKSSVGQALPDWLPPEAWAAFVAMRQKNRKPLTDAAIGLLMKKLDGFRQAGLSVEDALNQSTIAGWQGVFEPKRENVSRSGPQEFRQPMSRGDRLREQLGLDKEFDSIFTDSEDRSGALV
jgi:hypothetical protein